MAKIYLLLIRGPKPGAETKDESCPYICCDETGVIHGFPDEEKALRSVEEPYQQAHLRSYQSSMSACIHNIFFRPRVVGVDDIEDLRGKIVQIPFSTFTLRNDAGFFHGIPCEGPDAEALYDRAREPKLIDVQDLRERSTPKDARSAALDDERRYSRALSDQADAQRRKVQDLAQVVADRERQLADQKKAAEERIETLLREKAEVEEAARHTERQLRAALGNLVIP